MVRTLHQKHSRKIALSFLTMLGINIFSPLSVFALTSGPTQPEMTSFEPIGATNLVDMFSGDFSYNIPLMDVDGYPVNIAYHGGINAEEEASWVGLGWNINVGNVSRSVRGIPDDFNGETIEKQVSINQEIKNKYSLGADWEIFGVGEAAELAGIKMTPSLDFGLTFSNYSGVSSDIGANLGASGSASCLMGGVNLGITASSSSGLDVDYNLSLGASSPVTKSLTAAVNGSFGQSFNSREGLKQTTFGITPSVKPTQNSRLANSNAGSAISTLARAYTFSGGGSFIPISCQNYVPVVSNQSLSQSLSFQLKVGGTIFGVTGSPKATVAQSRTSVSPSSNLAAYGYCNLQNATELSMTDFSRDRDGRFHKQMKYLPPASMSYDLLSVNGQGTGGSFRAFRNDIGAVYDPATESKTSDDSYVLEVGALQLLEGGGDNVANRSTSRSQPWNQYRGKFRAKESNQLYEPYYYKQAGELTAPNEDFVSRIGGLSTQSSAQMKSTLATTPKYNYRAPRANLLYTLTNAQASSPLYSFNTKLLNHTSHNITTNSRYDIQPVDRVNTNDRPNHHIGEVTQVLVDGRRYIYGIPAMNGAQYEFVNSVDQPLTNTGKVNMSFTGPTSTAPIGQKLFYKTKTPAQAHSYLLTQVLSSDYVDVSGDGLTDDDLGTFTKFNYSRKSNNYQWKSPYEANQGRYDVGCLSDCHDDKATAVVGTKEIWMLHSIETKNMVAEFYVSPRADAKGSSAIVPGISPPNGSDNNSYKLDKIVLYNKQDRFRNPSSAVPIKTVLFTYDYSLCKGIPNTYQSGLGKLTLKAISIQHGTSEIGLLNPYRFDYGSVVTDNPDYDELCKDQWGTYKASKKDLNNNQDPYIQENGLRFNNHEFPYINQQDPDNDNYAGAWALKQIDLPSGGKITVQYEADDYAYVQNKKAQEFYKITGFGSSESYSPSNALYTSFTSPNLYLYFEAKSPQGDLEEDYIKKGSTMYFNINVDISKGERTASCPNTPLADQIKGYAKVEKIGRCNGAGNTCYIKLAAREINLTKAAKLAMGVQQINANPIMLAAINYSKYYNNKALYPKSEILEFEPAKLMTELASSALEIFDFVINPITSMMLKNKARYANLDKSMIRLNSQGNKKGGGYRVKRVEYKDAWDTFTGSGSGGSTNANAASYGSTYDYTTIDERTGKSISSGVASYEPLSANEENPFKDLNFIDKGGNDTKFPAMNPTELFSENPIGEAFYPSASVGYSKVTVKSIHKDIAESAQLIQENEFYTAKDFPVTSTISAIEDTDPDKANDTEDFSFALHKSKSFRVAQSFVLRFNDMHGKAKQNSTYVDNNGAQQLVAYTKTNYFTNSTGKELLNDIPVLDFTTNKAAPTTSFKRLGVELDYTVDSREKVDENSSGGFTLSVSSFLVGPVPIVVPIPLPKLNRKNTNTFSSVTATKIEQSYGIVKSVETFSKGAKVVSEHVAFDGLTGQPLITKVNTEHQDYEYQVKYPAYWAYQAMGPAYQNIHYQQEFDGVDITNDEAIIRVSNAQNFRVGDELILDVAGACAGTPSSFEGKKFKLWVTDIKSILDDKASGNCLCASDPDNVLMYSPPTGNYTNGVEYTGKFTSGYYSNSKWIQNPVKEACKVNLDFIVNSTTDPVTPPLLQTTKNINMDPTIAPGSGAGVASSKEQNQMFQNFSTILAHHQAIQDLIYIKKHPVEKFVFPIGSIDNNWNQLYINKQALQPDCYNLISPSASTYGKYKHSRPLDYSTYFTGGAWLAGSSWQDPAYSPTAFATGCRDGNRSRWGQLIDPTVFSSNYHVAELFTGRRKAGYVPSASEVGPGYDINNSKQLLKLTYDVALLDEFFCEVPTEPTISFSPCPASSFTTTSKKRLSLSLLFHPDDNSPTRSKFVIYIPYDPSKTYMAPTNFNVSNWTTCSQFIGTPTISLASNYLVFRNLTTLYNTMTGALVTKKMDGTAYATIPGTLANGASAFIAGTDGKLPSDFSNYHNELYRAFTPALPTGGQSQLNAMPPLDITSVTVINGDYCQAFISAVYIEHQARINCKKASSSFSNSYPLVNAAERIILMDSMQALKQGSFYEVAAKNVPGAGSIPSNFSYGDFPALPPAAWGKILEDRRWQYKCSAEVVDRQTPDPYANAVPAYLIAKAHKRGALDESKTIAWPNAANFNKGNVFVMRSGNRNMLGESIQEAELAENPLKQLPDNSYELRDDIFSRALSFSAKTFTDSAQIPWTLKMSPNTETYYNPFVVGAKGNYRPLEEFTHHSARSYQNYLNKNDGMFTCEAFWKFALPVTGYTNLYRMYPKADGQNRWFAKSKVDVYSPWGNDYQVQDAAGNVHSNLFAYNNQLPVAVVSNSAWTNALVDNFEDYLDGYQNTFIKDFTAPIPCVRDFNQNIFKQNIYLDIAGSGTKFGASLIAHSGKYGLEIKSNNTLSTSCLDPTLDVFGSIHSSLFPFYFRYNATVPSKYVVSYWQKVQPNATPPNVGAVKISYSRTAGGNALFNAYAKSPIIDGWVLYEANLVIETTLTGAGGIISNAVDFQFAGGNVIDDFRIVPYEANMKSYVYHPVNKRLLAVLDENNFASFFDYTEEGKLARIKKETEKGILTIKESRESLRSIFAPPGNSTVGSTSIPLVNSASLYTNAPIPVPPPIAPGSVLTVNPNAPY
jgi:hypothetical protein